MKENIVQEQLQIINNFYTEIEKAPVPKLEYLKSLINDGHWKNFKYNGFEHEFTENNKTIIITDQLSKKYGKQFPWKEWKDQNYSGVWVTGSDEVQVPSVPFKRIQNVLHFQNNKGPIISIAGSSVARQLFTSMILYLQEKDCCFTTPSVDGMVASWLLHKNFNQTVNGIDVRYHFSVSFQTFERGEHEQTGVSALLEPLLNADVNRLQLYVISDHLQSLHKV